jgi:hypothetical protein
MSIGVFFLWVLACAAVYFAAQEFAARYVPAEARLQFSAGWVAGTALIVVGSIIFGGGNG